MTTLRTCNNRAKRQRFLARYGDGLMVSQYVEDGIPTLHIWSDFGRERERGPRLRFLRSKIWKPDRVIPAFPLPAAQGDGE